MDINSLWDELNNLDVNNDINIEYKDINSLIDENPTKLVSYLDGIFHALSFKRMQQLALVNKIKELSREYFTTTNLTFAWKLIKSQMNCSTMEFNAANDFCKISETKFKRNLSNNEATEALGHLIFIAEIWVNQKIDLLGSSEPSEWKDESAVTIQSDHFKVDSNQQHVESMFLSTLRVLQSSSKESVVNADTFGSLRDYMHVERPIQVELVNMLTEIKTEGHPSLILLCGSVGDGKSHLLAFMKEKYQNLLEDVIIHNDSTESFNPDQNSLETLEQVLAPFDNGDPAERSAIIAINLGVLHNFYRRQRESGRFHALCDFIDRCGIFERSKDTVNRSGAFRLLNFAETQPYLLTNEGTKSPFFLELLNRVTDGTDDNLFYNAWMQDREKGIPSVAHDNYYLLQQSIVKESIVQSLIEVMIKQKVFVSTRTFYNFVYEIIVPVHYELNASSIKIEDMLPNLVYGHPDRSTILEALNKVDPLKTRLEQRDNLVSDFILSSDASGFVKTKLGEVSEVGAWKQVNHAIETGQQIEYSRLLIRHHELLNKQAYDETYNEYIRFLYSFYKGEEENIGRLFSILEEVIYSWKGSPRGRFIYMDSPNKTFRLAVEIDIEPIVDMQTFASASSLYEIDRFSPSIRIGYTQNKEEFLFELDYQLYVLLKRVSRGYRPNRQDIQDALQFSEFHDKLLKSADKTKNVLLVHKAEGAILEVKKPRFSKAKFEVEKVN